MALVLDAGDRGDIPVPGRVYLVGQVLGPAAALQVLGAVVPQQAHHHLTWGGDASR